MSEANAEAQVPEPEAAESKPSLLPKIAVSGFISFVVIVETLLFFFMVPNAEDVAALAETRLIDSVEGSISGTDSEDTLDEKKIVTKHIADFYESFVPPGAVDKYSVDFSLSVTIYQKDEQAFEELLAKKSERLKFYLGLEIRSANLDELHENQLGLIRRRILAKTTEILEFGEEENSVPQIIEVLPGAFVVREE